MTHHTRPTHLLLKLNLAALALLSVCAFAPRLRAWQTAAPTAQVARDPSAYFGTVSKEWLLYALRAREADEAALVRLVQRRGVGSYPSAEDKKELRAAGATDRLIEAVRKHVATPPPGGMGSGGGMGGEGPGAGPRRGVPAGPGGGGPGNPGSVDYTRTFRQNEVTRKALITFKPEPGYTEEARGNRVEGMVRLRAVLNASGEVTNITTVKGLPDGLSEKAIAAARQIKFTPAEKDGHKVSQYVVLEYNFTSSFPLNEGDVDERAIILEKPEAEYTEEARRAGVRGKVVLKVSLLSYRRVVVDSVEAGLPHGLNEKAAEAARRIVFEPARLGGRPVSQSVTLEYLFTP
jgi:TonB family protein